MRTSSPRTPVNDADVEKIFLHEREIEVLHQMMAQKDMSAEAVVRHMFRMGQLVDHYLQHGYRLMFHKDIHDVTEVLDPFYHGPKMAPMPTPQKEVLSCGCDVGCCICDIET